MFLIKVVSKFFQNGLLTIFLLVFLTRPINNNVNNNDTYQFSQFKIDCYSCRIKIMLVMVSLESNIILIHF